MAIDVLVYGSCRVHRPIDEAAASGRCGYEHGGSRAYLHSIGEAVQRLRWLKGEIEIPEKLAPLIFSRDRIPDVDPTRRDASLGSDVALIEVCSEKELLLGDVRLQMNYLNANLLRSLGPRGSVWWGELVHDGEPSRASIEAVLSSPEFLDAGFGEVEESILVETRCVKTDDARLEKALKQFRELWRKPFVIVTHVGLPLKSGRLLRDRLAFIERLRSIATRLAIPMFEPAPVITAVGRNRALQRNGEDLDHYAPSFELMYGWYLVNRVAVPALLQAA